MRTASVGSDAISAAADAAAAYKAVDMLVDAATHSNSQKARLAGRDTLPKFEDASTQPCQERYVPLRAQQVLKHA